jgi:hypothetical protein
MRDAPALWAGPRFGSAPDFIDLGVESLGFGNSLEQIVS